MSTKKTIRVGKGALVLRGTGNVLWVRDVESQRGTGSFGSMDTGALLVTSAPGCSALADALKEMAEFIRESKP